MPSVTIYIEQASCQESFKASVVNLGRTICHNNWRSELSKNNFSIFHTVNMTHGNYSIYFFQLCLLTVIMIFWSHKRGTFIGISVVVNPIHIESYQVVSASSLPLLYGLWKPCILKCSMNRYFVFLNISQFLHPLFIVRVFGVFFQALQ